MLIIYSIIFYFLSTRSEKWLWLAVPFSLVLDLWNLEKIGISGIIMITIIGLLWFVFKSERKESHRLKI